MEPTGAPDGSSAADKGIKDKTPKRCDLNVELTPPWSIDGQHRLIVNKIGGALDPGDIALACFISERSKVHELYIREQAKNKRLGLILSAFLVVVAVLVFMLAPQGRQTFSYCIGAVLFVFAAGASGFGRVWGKTKNISFGADQDRRAI